MSNSFARWSLWKFQREERDTGCGFHIIQWLPPCQDGIKGRGFKIIVEKEGDEYMMSDLKDHIPERR
jgi:hypothetical protein